MKKRFGVLLWTMLFICLCCCFPVYAGAADVPEAQEPADSAAAGVQEDTQIADGTEPYLYDEQETTDPGIAEPAVPEKQEAQDLADTGANADLSSTGYEDLGASFYARISSPDPKKYMTVPDDPMLTTQLKTFIDNGTQVWHFTRQSDGSYKIRNVYKNLYLELYNGTYPAENKETIHATVDNLPDQRWKLKKVGDCYQFYCCANLNFLLKAINLYGNSSEVVISKMAEKETTHFQITKLSYTSDYLGTPSVTLTNINGGVTVKWNKISQATSYRVYRYNDSTKKWVSLVKTGGLTYTDKSVTSGKTYQYKVITESPLSSKYKVQTITYLAPPTFKVTNSASGPVISWSKMTGAQAYRVYYKTTGSWIKLGDTKNTSLTHSKASYNVTYTYTVQCVSSDGKKTMSAYNASGVKNLIVKTPKITVTLKPNGYYLSWSKSTGASKYYVMVKSSATKNKWAKLVVTTGTAYTYTGAKNNQAYYFTVQCQDKNGKAISGYTSSAKYTYYSAPRFKTMKIASSKVTLSWNSVAGAAKYIVYSWNGKTWIKRAVTASTSTSFKVTGSAKQNKCFMVRCLNKSGKAISSYYEAILSGGKIVSYQPGGYSSKNKF